MTYLICGLLIIVALLFVLSKRLRYAIGDLLTSESDEAKKRKPWG